MTVVLARRFTVHGPVPEQPPPLHPANHESDPAAAVNVTLPLSNVAEQVEPQSMPAGFDLTVPLPAPSLSTVRVNRRRTKVAVTALVPSIGIVQGPVPEQPAPVQPAKLDPLAAVAVRVTRVPTS